MTKTEQNRVVGNLNGELGTKVTVRPACAIGPGRAVWSRAVKSAEPARNGASGPALVRY